MGARPPSGGGIVVSSNYVFLLLMVVALCSLMVGGLLGKMAAQASTSGKGGSGISGVVAEAANTGIRVPCPPAANPDQFCSSHLTLVRDTLTGTVLKTKSVTPFVGKKAVLAPYNAAARTAGTDWCDGCFTMAGTARIDNVRLLVQDVVKKNVPGDFLEAGTWRGGSSIMARMTMKCLNVGAERMVHVCDSFDGLPGASTGLDSNHWTAMDFLRVSVDQVRDNFRSMGALDNNVRFYKGYFQFSLPPLRLQLQKEGRKIAVLRGDGDMLESYLDILYNLYEFVPIGGYFICDDCPGIAVAMQAINMFRERHGIHEAIFSVTGSAAGMYWQKQREVPVQYSHYLQWNKTRKGR
jgi:O-methyltransferase